MSEHMEKNAVARLLGAPAGYVGYEEGGQSTEGAPKSLATAFFSIYSLISSLNKASSSSNNDDAKDFANSVLPTPVGPINKNDPIGLLGFFIPTLALRIAEETASIAFSCPITFSLISNSQLTNFFRSLETTLAIGIPVIFEITSAISSGSTWYLNLNFLCFFHYLYIIAIFFILTIIRGYHYILHYRTNFF
jgi:hypothetical protein